MATALLLIAVLTVTGCEDDKGTTPGDGENGNGSNGTTTNLPPDTWLSAQDIDTIDIDIRIHFFWNGWDTDGTVESFQWTQVRGGIPPIWNPIHCLDSIFVFVADPFLPMDTYFYVRAVDDSGAVDPTPAGYLAVSP